MRVYLTANAFDFKKGSTIDIAPNMAHYLIMSGRAKVPKAKAKSKKKREEAEARTSTRKRAEAPNNKMVTVENDK